MKNKSFNRLNFDKNCSKLKLKSVASMQNYLLSQEGSLWKNKMTSTVSNGRSQQVFKHLQSYNVRLTKDTVMTSLRPRVANKIVPC